MLKASSLKINELQKKAIQREVNALLPQIDDELKMAHEQGKHREVQINLPITFAIAYMANKDSQRIIYYEVLKSLVERGFEVEIDLKPQSTIFNVRWLTDDEITAITMQNAILAKHQKK